MVEKKQGLPAVPKAVDNPRPKAEMGPRPTEDDIAKAKLGPRGVPGEKDKPALDADELQIPKSLDPGHTA